jgi:hypothetical protein
MHSVIVMAEHLHPSETDEEQTRKVSGYRGSVAVGVAFPKALRWDMARSQARVELGCPVNQPNLWRDWLQQPIGCETTNQILRPVSWHSRPPESPAARSSAAYFVQRRCDVIPPDPRISHEPTPVVHLLDRYVRLVRVPGSFG